VYSERNDPHLNGPKQEGCKYKKSVPAGDLATDIVRLRPNRANYRERDFVMCCNGGRASLFLFANGLSVVNEQRTHFVAKLLIEGETSSGVDPAAQQY